MQLTATNTAVVLDSTADYPEGPRRFPNWRVVPLYVRFGAESFRDYAELGPQEFYERLRSAPELPTTSQPTPGDFLEVYEELAQSYEHILAITISSTLSGTHASAQAGAEMLGGDRVRVIDSRTVSAAAALMAIGVQRRLERGTTNEEIDAFVARFQQSHKLLFTVNTLEYLARGGRIGRAAAFAGNLLNVKPILVIEDGEVVPLKRVRGNAKAFAEFRDLFLSTSTDSPGLEVGIAHAMAPERMDALRELVQRERPSARIEIAGQLGPVVGTHAGPGTIGFFWFADSEA